MYRRIVGLKPLDCSVYAFVLILNSNLLRKFMMQTGDFVQSRLHGLLQININPVKVGDWEDYYTLKPPAIDHNLRAAASHFNTNSWSPVTNVVADKL